MYLEIGGSTQIPILLTVLILIFVGLFLKKVKPSFVFGAALIVLMLFDVVSIDLFLSSLSNQSVITIFLLIFITTALKDNFSLLNFVDLLFGKIKNPRLFVLSLTTLVAFLSSFVNNTPIVALLIPYVQEWSRKRGLSSSKFLIPLAYSATLGGMITLIGTSTNLVLNGLITSNGFQGFSFFEFASLGLIVTVLGLIYFSTIGYKLLPDRIDALVQMKSHIRDYVVETKLAPSSTMLNKSVQEAGLRHLDGIFLTEIVRDDQLISPVDPEEKLRANDLLYFAGETNKVMTLVNNPRLGLSLHTAEKFNLKNDSEIVEVLIPTSSELSGTKVKISNFRHRYDAAIIAIHRNGKKLGGKIGDVVLLDGDLLLLTTGKTFFELASKEKNLFIMSTHKPVKVINPKIKLAVGIGIVVIIGLMLANVFSLFKGLILMFSLLMATRLYTVSDLKKQFNIELLVILISALSIGSAIVTTGASNWLNDNMFAILQDKSELTIMIVIFFVTLIFTSFVTNIAAVAIVFPLTVAIITSLDLPAKPYFLTVAFAASASFLTPVSYQTNLMVYGPGGYRSKDFFKIGLPLTIIYSFICIAYLNRMLT